MGLDVSHGCWEGPCSQFMRWRIWIASQIGLPLELMEGFYGWEWEDDDLVFDRDYSKIATVNDNKRGNMWWDTLKAVRSFGRPIPWSVANNEPLVLLLHHSDCDGRIKWHECRGIAIRLGQILRKVDDDTREVRYDRGPNEGALIWADWRDGRGCYDGMVPATKRFIVGLLDAWRTRTDVRFR